MNKYLIVGIIAVAILVAGTLVPVIAPPGKVTGEDTDLIRAIEKIISVMNTMFIEKYLENYVIVKEKSINASSLVVKLSIRNGFITISQSSIAKIVVYGRKTSSSGLSISNGVLKYDCSDCGVKILVPQDLLHKIRINAENSIIKMDGYHYNLTSLELLVANSMITGEIKGLSETNVSLTIHNSIIDAALEYPQTPVTSIVINAINSVGLLDLSIPGGVAKNIEYGLQNSLVIVEINGREVPSGYQEAGDGLLQLRSAAQNSFVRVSVNTTSQP